MGGAASYYSCPAVVPQRETRESTAYEPASWNGPAASHPTCPASAAPASPARRPTRSTSTTASSSASWTSWRSSACSLRGARLGGGRPGVRPAPARARRAPGDHQRRAVPAGLPLAPHRAHLAHPGAGGAGDGRHQPLSAATAHQGVERHARARCRRSWIDSVLEHFDQGTQRAILRLYRSSPPERAGSRGARLSELTHAGAGGVGHAGPLHTRALRADVRAGAAQRRADRAGRRRPLAVAGPAGADRSAWWSS